MPIRIVLQQRPRPLAARRPCGYERRVLDNYVPNLTEYIPAGMKVRLHRMGSPIVAERVGTSHSAISRLESGQHRASIATLERVGEALGLRLVVSLEPVTA